MWTHSTMCCQYEAPAAPVAARITECEWNQGAGGEEIVLPTGSSDKLSARVGSRVGPLSSNLLAVVFEPELRRIGLPLVGSSNPAVDQTRTARTADRDRHLQPAAARDPAQHSPTRLS